MEEKLKPCPFCGSGRGPDFCDDGESSDMSHWIECLDCNSRGPYFSSFAEAESHWNTRLAHATLVAALKASLPLLEENQECLERSYMPEPSETEAEMLTAYSQAIHQDRAALKEVGE